MLVHGAGSGPWVFEGWAKSFPRVAVAAVDLQEGLEIATASSRDYAAQVARAAAPLPAPVALCGWSMGGLAVLQAAGEIEPDAVVLVEASPPGEVQGFEDAVRVAPGTFDPEEVYGRFPAGMRSRPESLLARAERKRGISVATLPCRSLVACGRDFPCDRGSRLAELYGSELVVFPDLDHWQLVLDPRVREAVAAFLVRQG